MASITLDIATRLLGETEDIYVIRPGENFSLYNAFVERDAVFLDFPDLRLPFTGVRPSRDEFRLAVVRSMALREWHRRRQPGREPSRKSEDYVRQAQGRRIGRYVGAIERLYYTLPEGAILVVPGPGYFSDVLVGQLVGKPILLRDVSLYPGEALPARRIEWIATKPKARFSEPLRDELQRSIPLMVLARSLRQEILEAAFDQYSIGGRFSARVRTTSADFSTLDDYNIQAFLNYVSGVLAAVEGGSADIKTLDMEAALKVLAAHRELVPELTANINSPGALRLTSQTALVISAAALLAVALSGCDKPSSIAVVNSAVPGDDPCAIEVQEKASAAVKMMDVPTWQRVCAQARDAEKQTGLKTTIKVVEQPDKHQ